MTVSMIDSLAGMRRLAQAQPGEWDEAARALWAPMAGMYFFIPGGPDLAQVHAQNFGFGPEAPRDLVLEGLEALEAADAWGRVERAVQDGLERLAAANPSMSMPDLRVLLVLGDPDNKHFMDEIRGLSAFGGISGFIAITVWPTSQVLDRLEAIALHELHHNVRYSPGGVVWDPRTVTVGEHVVAEGLADLFAAETYGARGFTHFVSDQTRTSDPVLARVVEGLGCKFVRVRRQEEIAPAIRQAEAWIAEFQVPVVVEVILERVTNISMGTEIDAINEFEELATSIADAPTAIAIGMLD